MELAKNNRRFGYGLSIIMGVLLGMACPATGYAGMISHMNDVVCMDFSPDGMKLLTVDRTMAKIWDTTTSTPLMSLQWMWLLEKEIKPARYPDYFGEVVACSFEPAVVVVSHYHGIVSAFDWSRPRLLMYFNKKLAEWLSRVEKVVWSSDKQHVTFVAEVSRGKDIDYLYSLETGQRVFDDALVALIRKESSRAPRSHARLDLDQDVIEVFSQASGERPVHQFPFKRGRHVWAFSPDDSIFGFSEGRVVQLWDLETGLNLQKARAIELEKAAAAAGVKIRYGFQEGKVGTRYVPVVTNTRYRTDTRVYVGDLLVTTVTAETHKTGGSTEDVHGVTAVFGVQNKSMQDFVVDLWIEATVTRSSWKRFQTFWTNKQGKELVSETSPLSVSKRFLLKAGEEIHDQIVVGENRPDDFRIYLAGFEPVDEAWIEGLDQALYADVSAPGASALAARIDAYLGDERAQGYRSQLLARQQLLAAHLDEPSATPYDGPGNAFTVRLEISEDYDPMFLSQVVIVATNRLDTEVEASVRGPEGKLHTIRVPANGEARRDLTVQVERNALNVTLERLVENAVLIDETFSDSRGGWHTEVTKERVFRVMDGVYTVENRAPGFGAWTGINHRVPLDPEHDFTIELTLIKGHGRNNTHYGFFWASEGWSTEGTVLNGYELSLDPWEDEGELNGFFSKIRFGSSVVYKGISLKTELDRQVITVRRVGDRTLVTINTQPIADVPFEGFFGDYLGFLVSGVQRIDVDGIRIVQQKPIFIRQQDR